jgi:hypothetical protein
MNTSTISKKQRITKNASKRATNKKKIENKLNTILLSLDNQLHYDFLVDDEYKSSLLEKDFRVNLDNIHKLPTYNIQFKTKLEEDENTEKRNKKNIRETVNTSVVEDDEYIKTLTIEKVGNILYRFDYDKGIIYDMKMNEVGHIDDGGDICLLNETPVIEEDVTEEQDETI